MNEERFWKIVAEVDWAGLCASGERRPYETGKERLLRLLPTIDDAKAFRKAFHAKGGALAQAFERWEKDGEDWAADHNPRSFPCGDDSFGDLTAHIVGLGLEVYEAEMADPALAHKRASDYDYQESFSYCIPWDDDYDPIEAKVERAQKGLTYWIERLVDSPDDSTARSEVDRRALEVAKLQAQATGQEVSTQAVETLVQATLLQAQETLVASLQEDLTELQERLYTEKNKLSQMRGE